MKEAYIIAGPNGSGKTTLAKELVKEWNLEFINADEIALALNPNDLISVRLSAGKLFLRQIEAVIEKGNSFAVETTLSGKYFVDIIKNLKTHGYLIRLIYIFVEDTMEAANRVKTRVAKGGHTVPLKDIERRFIRSKINFWNIYREPVDEWEMFYNSKDNFVQVAVGQNQDYTMMEKNAFDIFMEGL